ncbi:lysophospholipid acyltransferase family protein [Desulfosarcina sp.]|uniref:lysophospholipid acyltransferase family protein n=1 Tax=Desulfosarcina sp. TaxID=2027861 RepID=UPI003970E08F
METNHPWKWHHTLKDLTITLILWGYYTIGFVILFAPFYMWARLFSSDVALAFQRLNARVYRWFFVLLDYLVPNCRRQVDPAVKSIRGAVIVANHASYLDPILLISLFPQHATIAKRRLFHIPIYGRILRLSGYIPSSADGLLDELMLASMEKMPAFLSGGGNLIIFPEGTRSRDGGVGPLNAGAFKIARLCKAPIHVLYMQNTARLFRPGRFLFDTRLATIIRVEHLVCVEPGYDDPGFSLKALMGKVRGMLEERRSHAR